MKFVAQSHAAVVTTCTAGKNPIRRSQSFGLGSRSISHSLMGGAASATIHGTGRGMTKNDLFNKLHETLWEKDRLNETMTQAFRDKVESERHVITLTNDFGNL